MKLCAALLLALLVPAAHATAALSDGAADEEAALAALRASHPGWGRRQLLAKAKSNARHSDNGRGDDDNGGKKGGGRGGKTLPLAFTILTRAGAVPFPGQAPMGGLLQEDGSPVFTQVERGGTFGPVADPAETPGDAPSNNASEASAYYVLDGQQEVSTNPDYTSILPTGNKLYSFVHFEGPLPSQLYFMELSQAKDGGLTVVQQKPTDWSKWGGLWLPCAGSVTPWGSHLGSEEYEPDARLFTDATSLDGEEETSLLNLNGDAYGDVVAYMRYFGTYFPDLTWEKVQASFNPYHYGYITELSARSGFKYDNVKHYAMGRKSNEMGDVMPDQRTVYMADDGTNTAFYKFIAKRRGDLSEGSLYMAQTKQRTAAGKTGPAETTAFDVTWLFLGTAKQSEIERLVNGDGITFADIFQTAEPKAEAPFCPEGFTSINAGQADANHECLKVKPGKKKAAAFLETRRYGALLGGTTEFSKIEGMILNRKRRTLAVSVSDVRYGMENNQKQGKANTNYDIGGRNDVRLSYNPCGCVYEFVLTPSWDATVLRPLVCGIPSKADPLNSCSVDGIASPDNLSLLPEQNILIIGEDTSGHQNDMIWAYDYPSKQLTRIATSPYGSEYTSTDWYEINGWGYLTAVVQHPYGESDELRLLDGDSTGRAGTVGYIGPFPLSETKGRGLAFEELPYARTNSEKHNIRVTPSVTTI